MVTRDIEKRRETVRRATRKHYQNNKPQYLARNAKVAAEKLAVIRALRSQPCMDCGQSFPMCCMEFDHRGDKVHNISNIHKKSWRVMRAEIAKCDVVCANCHCIRTYTRRSGEMANTPVLETGPLRVQVPPPTPSLPA